MPCAMDKSKDRRAKGHHVEGAELPYPEEQEWELGESRVRTGQALRAAPACEGQGLQHLPFLL